MLYVEAEATAVVSNGQIVTHDFSLQRSGAIWGQVSPAGVRVLVAATNQDTGYSYTSKADLLDGTFKVIRLPQGQYRLEVIAPSSYLPASPETGVSVTAGQVSRNHQFSLQSGGMLKGKVTPIPEVGFAYALSQGDMTDMAVSAINPSTGEYSIVGLPTGNYNLAFLAMGYVRVIGCDTGVASSTLISSEDTDVRNVVDSWFQARSAKNKSSVLALFADSYTDELTGGTKTDLDTDLTDWFSELQTLSSTYSIDVVRGVTGASAAVVLQNKDSISTTGGKSFDDMSQRMMKLVYQSGNWRFSSGRTWSFYEPGRAYSGETTPVASKYVQNSIISGLAVTAGQETQVADYTLTPALNALSIGASPGSPRAANTDITLTATPNGGARPEYKFEVSTDGGANWTAIRDYSSTASHIWTPSTASNYTVRVTAREAGTDSPTFTNTMAYTIVPALSSVALGSDPGSPQNSNTQIALTGTPTGGQYVEYEFSASSDAGATWNVLREFGASATYVWVPTSSGQYRLRVTAREQGTTSPVYSDSEEYTVN